MKYVNTEDNGVWKIAKKEFGESKEYSNLEYVLHLPTLISRNIYCD
jgi:hypothetical protein